jgi:type IV secretion system protein VirD4
MQVVLQVGGWGQAHQWTLFYVMLGFMVLMIVLSIVHGRHRAHATTHGSARWATRREVKRAGLFARRGVIVGRCKGQIMLDDSEMHMLLCGPTRGGRFGQRWGGKGTGVIIPTLLCLAHLGGWQAAWPESAIVTDPKDGETVDATAPGRKAAGQRVAIFCPHRSPQVRINVRDFIRLKTPHECADATTIAQSLTAPEKMARESATSLHFRELATLLLTAALLHVCYTVRQASLAALWRFLTQQQEDLHQCLAVMRQTQHSSQGIHQAIFSLTSAIKNITGDRELSSVWSTAIRPLVLFNDPLVAASTDTSTLDLHDLQYGPDPVTLYLVAESPRALERLHPLYRVILDVAMARLMQHPTRTWRHRLLFVGDELPAYGYIRAIEKGAADMAGYGMKLLAVTQDLAMLEEVYGERSALWGNTDVKIFQAPTNDYTAKRISENLMGRGTMVNPVEQRQAGVLGRHAVSLQHVARALLTPDEVMELDPRKEIVRLSGMKPILCERVNYRRDPEFAGVWGRP